MISHVVFGFLALLYYLIRLIVRALLGNPPDANQLLRSARSGLETLLQQYGGAMQRTRRNGWGWYLPDGSNIEISRRWRPTLILTVPTPMEHYVDFQRIPRPLFDLAGAYISELGRVGSHPYSVTAASPQVLLHLKERPEFVRMFERLSQEGFSVRANSHGFRAWKRLRERDCNDIALYEHLRLLRDFARVCAGAGVLPVQSLDSTPRCAYCHEEMPDHCEVIHCASCSTPHHQECFDLNGKCSVFGCGSMRPAEELLLTR